MEYSDFMNRLERIFAACNEEEKKLDCKIQEWENQLQFENFKIKHVEKKAKYVHQHNSPQQINCKISREYREALDGFNKIINKKHRISNKENTILQPTAALQTSYKPTPVSTKMNIRNVLKDTGNLQTKDPVAKIRKNLMDVKKPQDDSTNSFIKLPSLIPKVALRGNITFDDLDTDDEQAKGTFPKWSVQRHYMKKLKQQTFVDLNFAQTLFSCPPLDFYYGNSMTIFPKSNPINLIRNESSIWQDEN